MNDIVDRLRETAECADYVVDREIAAEAVAEITRLTAEVERLRAALEHLRAELNEHGGRYWEARYRDEASDNERLRAALSGVVREWEEYRSDGWDGDVPFIVGVTMAGIARAALDGKSRSDLEAK